MIIIHKSSAILVTMLALTILAVGCGRERRGDDDFCGTECVADDDAADESAVLEEKTPATKPRKKQSPKQIVDALPTKNKPKALPKGEPSLPSTPPTDSIDEPSDDHGRDDANDDEDPAPVEEVPEWVELTDIQIAGTGCPAGSAELVYLHDGKSFELTTDDFVARRGPDVLRREIRKMCQVLFDLGVPDGWQFSLKEAKATIHLDLVQGVNAKVLVSHHIQGSEGTVEWEKLLAGPRTATEELTLTREDQLWSPCSGGPSADRALIVKYDLRIEDHVTDDALQPLGSAAMGDPAALTLTWRRCQH